jgi:Family of unknown function (DUF5719)
MHEEENDGGKPGKPFSGPATGATESKAAGSAAARSKASRGRSSGATRVAGRGAVMAGLLSGAVILASGGGLVAAASLAPQPSAARPLEPAEAAVPAGSVQDVCPAPARLLQGTPVGTDPQFSPESATAKSAVSAAVVSSAGGNLPGSALTTLKGPELQRIAKAPASATAPAGSSELLAGAVEGQRVDDVSVLSADALANRQPAAAALMAYTATDGDLQGSAAAACQTPSNDLWLSGANTAVGRSSVLNLTNASTTPATVNLELYGKAGQVKAAGSRGLLVGPKSTRSIVLAGLAPGEERLSVHVRSSGGPVSGFIQQSVLRGLTSGGLDFIAPGVSAGTTQVMTGVDIQDAADVKSLTGESGFDDAGPSLQITVPGASDAVVEVKLFGRAGQQALPGGGVVTAKAGTVTEVPLSGVPAGQYTVSATSDVSVVAAARVSRGLKSSQSLDFAWSPASDQLGSQHVVPLPQGGERLLVFGALDGRATISYTPITADGKLRTAATADIAAGTTTALKAAERIGNSAVVGYLVSASGGAAYGAVLLEREGRNDVSTMAIAPGADGQEKIPVTLGY